MFNQREQVALLLLVGSLLVGSALAVVDWRHPDALEEFQVIPAAVEAPVVETASAADEGAATEAGPVELNGATADQLQSLPGVGPKTAARILAHRQQYGPFRRLEDLQQVPGIGPRTLEKLRPWVRIQLKADP